MVSEAAIDGLSGAAGGVVALLATYPLMTISTLQATRGRKTAEEEQLLPLAQGQQKKTGTLSELAEIVRTDWRGLYRGLQPALLGTMVSQGLYFYLYSELRQAFVARKRLAAGNANTADTRGEDLSVATSLIVAAFAGCGNVLLTNPIWVVATRMQAAKPSAQGGSKPGPAANAQEIYEEDGILGFWKGVVPSLVMVSNPTVQYVLYEWLTSQLKAMKEKSGKSKRFSGGDIFLMSALAKLGATVATYPLLLVKSRLQAASKRTEQQLQYAGTWDAITRIFKSEGLLGFYDGMRAKIVQSVLAAALLFLIKEEMTEAIRRLLAAPALVAPLKAVQR